MQVPTPVDIRQVWEERYRVPKVGTPGDDDWLARWQESVDAAWGQRGLDIGVVQAAIRCACKRMVYRWSPSTFHLRHCAECRR